MPGPVLISGAASGIGLELARTYWRRGHDLYLIDRQRVANADAFATPTRQGQTWQSAAVDVTDDRALSAQVDAWCAPGAGPSLAIHCAGIQCAKLFSELSADEFRRVIDVNLIGARNFAAAALPHLRPGNRLALVSSLAGALPNITYAAYNASKFGVVGLAECLRMEYLTAGIGISVICPGEVDTPLSRAAQAAMHPATRALKQAAGHISVEQAVTEITTGLDRGEFMIIPGARARAVYRLRKYLPARLLTAIIDRKIRKSMTSS